MGDKRNIIREKYTHIKIEGK